MCGATVRRGCWRTAKRCRRNSGCIKTARVYGALTLGGCIIFLCVIRRFVSRCECSIVLCVLGGRVGHTTPIVECSCTGRILIATVR